MRKEFIEIYNKHWWDKVSIYTAYSRYKLHWDIKKALYDPLMGRKFITYWNQNKDRVWKWIDLALFRHRVYQWWDIEKALITDNQWLGWVRIDKIKTEFNEAKKKYKVEVTYYTYRLNRKKWLSIKESVKYKKNMDKTLCNIYKDNLKKVKVSLDLFRHRVKKSKRDINEALFTPPYWKKNNI